MDVAGVEATSVPWEKPATGESSVDPVSNWANFDGASSDAAAGTAPTSQSSSSASQDDWADFSQFKWTASSDNR